MTADEERCLHYTRLPSSTLTKSAVNGSSSAEGSVCTTPDGAGSALLARPILYKKCTHVIGAFVWEKGTGAENSYVNRGLALSDLDQCRKSLQLPDHGQFAFLKRD